MKPDLLTVWPRHTDFSLWRQFIRDNRDHFAKVIIVFSNMKTEGDFRQFIQDAMAQDRITFVENDEVPGHRDWRDVAVNKGLKYSDAEWIWFTEEDFFPKEGFWDDVDKSVDFFKHQVFGVFQEGRLHPCCIFIKRSLLDQTNKNFGVVRDQLDHFGLIQQDLRDMHIPIGILPNDPDYVKGSPHYHHMNGLSQNMHMLQTGQEPNYSPKEFKEYCKKCLEVSVLMNEDIKGLLEWYLNE